MSLWFSHEIWAQTAPLGHKSEKETTGSHTKPPKGKSKQKRKKCEISFSLIISWVPRKVPMNHASLFGNWVVFFFWIIDWYVTSKTNQAKRKSRSTWFDCIQIQELHEAKVISRKKGSPENKWMNSDKGKQCRWDAKFKICKQQKSNFLKKPTSQLPLKKMGKSKEKTEENGKASSQKQRPKKVTIFENPSANHHNYASWSQNRSQKKINFLEHPFGSPKILAYFHHYLYLKIAKREEQKLGSLKIIRSTLQKKRQTPYIHVW